ncbi:MAG: tetratricopeptide repeat protein, partial [Vulcanimicrobiaceae bacterium]
ELMCQLCGWSEDEALGHLDDLIARHLVRETDDRRYGYHFSHQLVQEFAYAQISESDRARRHLRVARAVETLYAAALPELATELAHHYRSAGRADRAVAYFIQAARRALELYANEDAVEHADQALALACEPPDEFAVRLVREEAFRRAGRRADQRAELERLALLVDGLDERSQRCEMLGRKIALEHAIGDRDAEQRAIAELAELSEDSPYWRAVADHAEGTYLVAVSRYGEARAVLLRAARGFDELDDLAGAVESRLALLVVSRAEKNDREADATLAKVEQRLDGRIDTQFVRVKVLRERIDMALHRRAYPVMTELALELLELARAIGDLEGEAIAFQSLGAAASWQFDIRSARINLARASELFEMMENREKRYAALVEFGLLAIWVGQLDEAIATLQRAYEHAVAIGFPYGEVACLVNLAHAYALSGDCGTAKTCAQRAIDRAELIGAVGSLPALVNRGIAERELGEHPDAIASLTRAAALAVEQDNVALREAALANLALAYALAGDPVSATATLDEADPLLLSSTGSPDAAETNYLAAGQAARLVGRARKAKELLDLGRAICERHLEAIPDADARRAFASLAPH